VIFPPEVLAAYRRVAVIEQAQAACEFAFEVLKSGRPELVDQAEQTIADVHRRLRALQLAAQRPPAG